MPAEEEGPIGVLRERGRRPQRHAHGALAALRGVHALLVPGALRAARLRFERVDVCAHAVQPALDAAGARVEGGAEHGGAEQALAAQLGAALRFSADGGADARFGQALHGGLREPRAHERRQQHRRDA